MIKRLFRTWMRYKLVRMIGERETNFEEVFEWIYNSPITDWKIMLYLARRFDECIDSQSHPNKFKVDLSRAKEVLNFIKN